MKIIELIYSYSSGGAERFGVDLSNELAKDKNNEVTIVSLKDDRIEKNAFYKHELADNVKNESLKYKKINIKIFFSLFMLIKRKKPDIVHLQADVLPILCIIPILLLRKVIYIQTIHNKAEISFKTFVHRIIVKQLYKHKLHHLITISDENDKSFKRVFNLQSTALIYNGTRELKKSDNFINVQDSINKLKRNDSTITLIHIGRCVEQKNQELLIRSFNKIIDKNYNAILLIIGSQFDNELGCKLKAIANKNIFFLGEKKNVQDYLFCSNGFCLSSLYEGMPITLLESFASGTIPISTPVSGAIDLISNSKNGYISQNFSIDSYTQTLEEFLKNYNTLNTFASKKRFQNDFSIKTCAEKYNNLFIQLCQEN